MYLLGFFFKGKLSLYLLFSLFDIESFVSARNTLLLPVSWLSIILSQKKDRCTLNL